MSNIMIRVKTTRTDDKVHALPLEEYLCGVVPSEIVPSWPDAALHAQAVAARTYAMHKVKTRENQEYDVWDTTADQAFSIAKRHPRTDDAICATVGQILTYNGKILDTCVYCASNGGQVRSSKEVWGGHRPYLIARSDMFDKRAGKAKNGHGVGMSQWGACQMAVEGRDYEAILGFYYPGAHIVNLSELT